MTISTVPHPYGFPSTSSPAIVWVPAAALPAVASVLGETASVQPLPEDPSGLREELGTGRGLILYPGLAEVIAELDRGDDLAGRGLAVWIARIESILAVWAGLRRQISLAPVAIAESPAALCALLNLAPPEGEEPQALAVPAEARVLAATIIQVSETARALLGRLEAASLAMPETPPEAGLVAALDDLVHEAARPGREGERRLGLELRRHQNQTEMAAQETRRIQERQAARIAELETELEEASVVHVAIIEARNELARALGLAEEEMGRQVEVLARTEQEGAERTRAAIAAEREELARVLNTAREETDRQAAALAALEAEREVLARRAAETENLRLRLDLTAGTLAEVQAAAGATAASLSQRGAELDHALTAATADLARLARDIQVRDGRIRLLAQSLQQAEEEVAALRSSTSWRLTAPLRRVSLGLRRIKG